MHPNKIMIYCREKGTLSLLLARLESPDNLLITAKSVPEVKSLVQSEDLDFVVITEEGNLSTLLDLLRLIRQLPFPPECVVVGFDSDRETILQVMNAGCSYFLDFHREIENICGIVAGLLDEKRERIRQREECGIGRLISSVETRNGKSTLSRREVEILYHMLRGKSNREISEELKISEKTVKNHLWKIYRKSDVENRTQLFYQLLRSCPCLNLTTVEV
jgi:DNA-binding NarL/FixJ family response regulator